jgi:hypothetical protein
VIAIGGEMLIGGQVDDLDRRSRQPAVSITASSISAPTPVCSTPMRLPFSAAKFG